MLKELTNRQKQAIETKMNIVKVAMDLFGKHGFYQVTIRDICKEAGISIGAFYHHFEAKEDLITVGQQSMDMIIVEKLKSLKLTGTIDDIRITMIETAKFLKEFGLEFMKTAYAEIISQNISYSISEDRYFYVFLEELIKDGVKEERFESKKPIKEMVNDILRYSRGSVYEWCIWDGSKDLELLVDEDIGNYLYKICEYKQ